MTSPRAVQPPHPQGKSGGFIKQANPQIKRGLYQTSKPPN